MPLKSKSSKKKSSRKTPSKEVPLKKASLKNAPSKKTTSKKVTSRRVAAKSEAPKQALLKMASFNKMPYYPSDILRSLIQGPAKELGWKPWDLLRRLEVIAAGYVEAILNYREAKTRGEILHSLTDVLQKSDEKLKRGIGILSVETIQAMMGFFPNTLARYTNPENHDHIAWVANDDAIMEATFQNRMALQSRRNEPTLVRVEIGRVGCGIFGRGDEDIYRHYLGAIADVDPGQVRELVRDTIQSLIRVFQFSDGTGGRNTRVLDGARANADWQLFNTILDEVWPIENGELYPTKRKPIRSILNAVMIYVWGEEKPKRGKGNGLPDKNGRRRVVDKTFFFDKGMFAAVLTLRHQINSLRRALEIVDRRFAEIQRSRETIEDAGALLNAVDRIAHYPLTDWVNELERRLQFGDYRAYNGSIRRPTGEILRTPGVPKFRKTTTEYERMHALIEAAAPLIGGGNASRKDKRLLSKAFSGI